MTPVSARSSSVWGPLLAERATRRLGVGGLADSNASFVAALARRAERRLTDVFEGRATASFVMTLAGRATGSARTIAGEPAHG